MGSKSAIKERKKQATTAPVEVDADACRHHWIIESPQGALSSGRCKRCGEEREFRNSANDYIWDDDSSTRGGYGRGGLGSIRSTAKTIDDDDMTAAGGPGRSGAALAV